MGIGFFENRAGRCNLGDTDGMIPLMDASHAFLAFDQSMSRAGFATLVPEPEGNLTDCLIRFGSAPILNLIAEVERVSGIFSWLEGDPKRKLVVSIEQPSLHFGTGVRAAGNQIVRALRKKHPRRCSFFGIDPKVWHYALTDGLPSSDPKKRSRMRAYHDYDLPPKIGEDECDALNMLTIISTDLLRAEHCNRLR